MGDKYPLTNDDKKKLRAYADEFASNNPAPTLNEAKLIKAEKAADIAAAYKDDPEGLKKRREDIYKKFEDVHEEYCDYFTEKNEAAKAKLNEEKK